MGQYYELLNATLNTVAHPHDHGCGCKWGEFNPYEIMKQMNWSMDDAVIAIGDYGTMHNLTDAADRLAEKGYDDELIHYQEQLSAHEEGSDNSELLKLSLELDIIADRITQRKKDDYVAPYSTLDEMISRWK